MLMWNVAWVVGNLEWLCFFSKWYLGISWLEWWVFFSKLSLVYLKYWLIWFHLIWFDYLVNWWGWVDLTFSCLNDLGIAWLIELMWPFFDNIGIAWLGWVDVAFFFWYIPGSFLSFILRLKPSKTRSFPTKTRVIWVPGIYIYTKSLSDHKKHRSKEMTSII